VARQGERERANRLRTLFMCASADSKDTLHATDALPAVAFTPMSFEESLGVALTKRQDFLMRKVMVEREGVQLSYAENQTLPRIDLVASYGINGLEYSEQTAFNWQRMSDYPTWSLGVQMQIPLDGNRQGRADLRAAALRREDAMLSLKAAEIAIANDIDTSLALRASVAERWELWRQIAEREQKQLDLERRKFTAGRSDVREVLQREERVINAKVSTLEQQAAYAKAQTMLDAAQGTLLERLP
jgi:outer membrane protein TolC